MFKGQRITLNETVKQSLTRKPDIDQSTAPEIIIEDFITNIRY